MLGIQEIMKALPHRPPFLMAERILEVRPNERVVGLKNISVGEPWAVGHFPDEPLFPGVLIIETMAQIGGFCFWSPDASENQLRGYLSGVDKVKFLKPVVPGDTLVVEGTVSAKMNNLAQVKCEAKVNGELVASAVISYAFR
jgi:3-hydroxyacyl-[acyl-carrier-protein] dehydratase